MTICELINCDVLVLIYFSLVLWLQELLLVIVNQKKSQ